MEMVSAVDTVVIEWRYHGGRNSDLFSELWDVSSAEAGRWADGG